MSALSLLIISFKSYTGWDLRVWHNGAECGFAECAQVGTGIFMWY